MARADRGQWMLRWGLLVLGRRFGPIAHLAAASSTFLAVTGGMLAVDHLLIRFPGKDRVNEVQPAPEWPFWCGLGLVVVALAVYVLSVLLAAPRRDGDPPDRMLTPILGLVLMGAGFVVAAAITLRTAPDSKLGGTVVDMSAMVCGAGVIAGVIALRNERSRA